MLQTAEMDKIIGRFSMINNKLLVIMDETSGKDSFSNSDKIKNIITAEQVAWERKGIDGVNINNCGRYIFFSNNSTPVKIEHSDRRYVVYKCANDVQNNAVYFKELVRYFKDEQIMKAFYDFLMQRDISNWDSINDRPITKAYHDIQSANIPAMANYLTERIMIFQNATPEEKILPPSATDLFNNFVSWLRENGFTKMEYTSTKFGREISEYEGVEKKRSASGNVYIFNYETLQSYLVKKRWMELPE
jgi:putative DNA primase/helicase